MNEKCPKIKVLKPEGSYLLWLDFSAFDLSDSQINDKVLNKAKVWLDGGTHLTLALAAVVIFEIAVVGAADIGFDVARDRFYCNK